MALDKDNKPRTTRNSTRGPQEEKPAVRNKTSVARKSQIPKKKSNMAENTANAITTSSNIDQSNMSGPSNSDTFLNRPPPSFPIGANYSQTPGIFDKHLSFPNDMPLPPDNESILNQLELDTKSLSPELASLAQAIVKAMMADTAAKIAVERRRHEEEVSGLKRQIQALTEDKDDLEQYGRRNTIVISGVAVPAPETHEDCYDLSQKLISDNTGVSLTRADIDVCHRLKSPKQKPGCPERRSIIVKFVRRETKHIILQACKIKKPNDLRFSESLTRTRNKILFVIRKLKYDYKTKISSFKTEDGNIRVYTPTPGDSDRLTKWTLNTRRELDDFMKTKFDFDSTKYVKANDWGSQA